MPIIKQDLWQSWVDANQDDYGGCCVKIAAELMEMLDEGVEVTQDSVHGLITTAEKRAGEGGITGFMAGAIASMVNEAHSRGEEFRRAWNKEVAIGDEGDRATEAGATLNPALMTINT